MKNPDVIVILFFIFTIIFIVLFIITVFHTEIESRSYNKYCKEKYGLDSRKSHQSGFNVCKYIDNDTIKIVLLKEDDYNKWKNKK